jgi:predicted nuclease of predicted toxin-antitoxin system
MKLLFDQNISYRIPQLIEDIFPESKQVRNLKLENTTDRRIWDFAKKNNYCIVTFDSDFYDLSLVQGSPPKIIWLRMGNTSTKSLEKIIRENEILIKEFLENSDYKEISCLELD